MIAIDKGQLLRSLVAPAGLNSFYSLSFRGLEDSPPAIFGTALRACDSFLSVTFGSAFPAG
jgi:hypothetical protein